MQSKPIYLTNACGETTGYGSMTPSDSDLNKVAFENGPGSLLVYLAEIDGRMYLLGNQEVAYNDEFWMGEQNFEDEVAVRAYCEQVVSDIQTRLSDVPGAKLLPIDEGDPGRLTVGVAVPLASVQNPEQSASLLAQLFGRHIEIDDEAITKLAQQTPVTNPASPHP